MRIFVLTVCLVVLGGCAAAGWQAGMRPWWTLNERDFAAITPQTSKADVERSVGKPLLAQSFNNLHEDVWNYRFLEGGVRRFAAEVHFHQEGGVKYVATYLDYCTFGPVGCP